MSFIRRFGYFPSESELTAIEGVAIVDLAPGGGITAVGTGTTALIGEFPDMTYALQMSAAGVFSSKYRPTEVYSAQDLLDKFGGFDSTLGDFGTGGTYKGSMGNGFVELRNKAFARLVVCPINLASAYGVRLYRDLPTNRSATSATPAVPMAAGLVAAGREFKSGSDRVRVAKRVVFTDDAAFLSGVDGSVTAAGAPAATQFMTAASVPDWSATNVQIGDIVVIGVIGAAAYQGANAGTYRVKALSSGGAATKLVVEKLSGATFDWSTGVANAWRIHPGTTADSAGDQHAALATEAAYTCPVRVLGVAGGGKVSASTVLPPTIVPAAGTATTCDPLSGLGLVATTNAAGLAYDANTQAPNAPQHADIDAKYEAAIQAFLGDDLPMNEVNIAWCARKSAAIAIALRLFATSASARGLGRVVCISPAFSASNDTVLEVITGAYPAVAANRLDRVFYAWPGVRTLVPEAVGVSIPQANASVRDDGILDTTTDGWLAAVLSVLPPERNPAQAARPATTALAAILGFATDAPTLDINDYIMLRAAGIVAPKMDRTAGPCFQSGVTTSLATGEKNISRRRMADFLQDSIAARLIQFSKLPLTQGLKDSMESEVVAFLSSLLSENDPSAQRISAFAVDSKSGNTDSTEAAGIHVIIMRVRTLATADVIVLQSEVGEGVQITQQ